MSDNIQLYLQIINVILSFLSPIVFSTAYLIRKINKSRCCKSSVVVDFDKSSENVLESKKYES